MVGRGERADERQRSRGMVQGTRHHAGRRRARLLAAGARCGVAAMRVVAALGVLCALGAPPPAAAQGGGQRSGAGAFTRDVLPGGLAVLVEERPGTGLVAVEVAVLAGARFEYGPTAGAAQFMEQLFQDGTPTRPTRGDVLR